MDKLSDRLDGEISFEKIHLKPFTTLVLKNAVIIDKHPASDSTDPAKPQIDTFFRAEYIIAKFTLDGLVRHQGIHLGKAFISNARMNLVLEDNKDTLRDSRSTQNLSRIFRLKKNPDKKKNEKELFHIRKVEIHNMTFAMYDYGTKKTPHHGGINWNDLEINNININARELQFKGGIMSGTADRVSFKEKSGYVCNAISGSARVGNGRTIIEDLKVDDLWSDVHLSTFMMSYTCAKDFSDFIEKVRIDGDIMDSDLDFKTLSFFVPALEGNGIKARVSGKVSGYINDLQFIGLKAATATGGFSGTVDGRLTGLPVTENLHIDAKVRRFHLTADGLGLFVSEWMKKGRLDLGKYAKGTIFMADARAKGFLDRLDVKAKVSSMLGKAEADIRLDNLISKSHPLGISGNLKTDNLDIGGIAGISLIRQCTMETGIKAVFGSKTPEVTIDSLFIDRLAVKGYDYSGIAAAGKLAHESFNGRIICNDPSLNFLFQGTFALSDKTQNALYQFYANIGHADLNAMHLDRRGKSKIRLQTSANFTRTGSGDLLGKIDVGNIVLENDLGKHDIGDISLTSHSNDDKYRIRLSSGFADGVYNGTASITRFIKDLQDVTIRRELPALFKNQPHGRDKDSYELNFKCHDSMDLLAFVMPGLYIADSTSLNITIDRNGLFKAAMTSPRIAYKGQYIKRMEAVMDNSDSNLSGEIAGKEMKIATLTLNDNSLQLYANDNRIGAGYSYDNHSDLDNRGEFYVRGGLTRPDDVLNLSIDVLPSTLYLNSKEWNIQPSTLNINGKEIDVRDFEVTNGEQRVRLTGRTSAVQKDTLTLGLDRFDISIINSLIGKDFGIKGAATGQVRLTSPMQEKGLLVNMICDSTYIASQPLGVLDIGSFWDDEFERFDIKVRNDMDGKSNLDIRGRLTPKLKTLEASIGLDRLSVGYAQPFLKDIFSEMDGKISGSVLVDGPLDALKISSRNTRLDGAMLKVAYTNVPYYADGTFHIDGSGVYFDDMAVRDRATGRGHVTGSINWDNFRDLSFDTTIKVSDMECIDIEEKKAEYFYGNLYATGSVAITGPVKSLLMTVDAVTSKKGQLHIPLSGQAKAGSTNLLKFKELEKIAHIDPYEAMITRFKAAEKTGGDFALKMHVNAMPDVEAFVEIDKASGNVLSGRGSGTIELDISNDVFDINGDYTLTGGSYKFVVMGLVSRDFTIQNGSSIRFNGDIMDSSLDIDAIYKTKASLSTLISDTTSVTNRRPVECGISITEKLSNPRLGFSIEIPDLDPTIKSRVESALSTEDKVQKQFLSLLVSNSFLPDEQSGIVNNSTTLYTNVTEMVANQLNNIFQKLNIPLDLGLKYQPNEKGTDIFDVAVSTQLFNNRVVVNGSVGNKQYTSSSQNDVVGDLDIEIKLDRPGAFRLNIFSHSADQYTNYLDNSQRNGVGLTYQTEFNTLGQFFRNMFSTKARRQEARRAEEQALSEGGKVTVQIEAPDRKTGKSAGTTSLKADRKTDGVDRKMKSAGKNEKDKKTDGNDRKQRKAVSDTVSAGRQ